MVDRLLLVLLAAGVALLAAGVVVGVMGAF
jgi:hypothetical protein